MEKCVGMLYFEPWITLLVILDFSQASTFFSREKGPETRKKKRQKKKKRKSYTFCKFPTLQDVHASVQKSAWNRVCSRHLWRASITRSTSILEHGVQTGKGTPTCSERQPSRATAIELRSILSSAATPQPTPVQGWHRQVYARVTPQPNRSSLVRSLLGHRGDTPGGAVMIMCVIPARSHFGSRLEQKKDRHKKS